MSTLTPIINDLKKILKKYELATSFIFGSLANKTTATNKFNDLDILIVFRNLTSPELKRFKKDIKQICSKENSKFYIFPEFRGGPVKRDIVSNKKIIQLHFSLWKNLNELKTTVGPTQWFTILKKYQHLSGSKIDSLIKTSKVTSKDIFEWPIEWCLEVLRSNKLFFHMLCATNKGVVRRKYQVRATKKEHIATSIYFVIQHTKNLLLIKNVQNLNLLPHYFPKFKNAKEIEYFIKIKEKLNANDVRLINEKTVRNKAIHYLTELHNFVNPKKI